MNWLNRGGVLKARGFAARALVWLVIFCAFSSVRANPVLDNVTAGQAVVTQTPTTTTINQTSQQAIIHWKSFNIHQNEATHFQQPAGGVALNRINADQGPSSVYGSLTATGRIILINPAGIFFGPSAYVNVGGIIASTANLSDQNFLNGIYRFDQTSPLDGSVINRGTIIAIEHGLVALVGSGVSNEGYIEASMGSVVLASGNAFTVNFAGNEMIGFSVDKDLIKPGVDENGRPLPYAVNNSGRISANGGKVLITAGVAQNVLDNVINVSGYVGAKSVAKINGDIVISASTKVGRVKISGKLEASGRQGTEQGGKVTVTGHNILLEPTAVIDVSGNTGGGDILIGGNAHGIGALPHANAVVLAPGAMLIADATDNGQGGNIVLWSDNYTRASGSISAKGGANGGNGGFAETSGHLVLDIHGILVNLTAAKGITGTWLLDPRDVYITTSATSGGSFDAGNPDIFTPISDNSNILNTDIVTNLATADVTITTGSDGTQNGDIFVNAPINWSSAFSLLLVAAGSIEVNALISNTTNSGNLTLQADTIVLNNGAVTTMGDQTYTATTSITLGANTVLTSSAGNIVIASSSTGLDGGGFDLTIDNDGTASAINSDISNLGALNKDGNGTLILAGANSYSGDTTILDGILDITNNSALGTGEAIVNAGASLRISGDALSIGNNITLHDGSSLVEAATFFGNTITGDINIDGTVTIDVENTFADGLTLTGLISGTGITINKTGSQYLTLSGSNTFTGTTNITAGKLVLTNSTGLGDASATATFSAGTELILTGALIVPNNLTFNSTSSITENNDNNDNELAGDISFNGSVAISVTSAINDVLTLSGQLSGTSITLNKSGPGTLVIGGVAANTYTGTTNINAGVVRIQKDNALGTSAASAVISTGAVLEILGTALSIANNITLNGTGISSAGAIVDSSSGTSNTLSGTITLGSNNSSISVLNTGNALTIANSIGDGSNDYGFSKLGLGELVLSAANTFGNVSNGLTISAGQVTATNNDALGASTAPTTVIANAILALDGGITIANPMTLNGTGIASSGALYNVDDSNTVNGAITLGSNGVSVGVFDGVDTLILNGTITDDVSDFSFTKVGAGTLTLSNTNSVTGATSVSAGTLKLTNDNALGTSSTHTSSVAVSDGAVIHLSNVSLAPTLALSLSGNGIASSGALFGSGTSTWNGDITLTGNTSITTSGALTVNGKINDTSSQTLTLSGAGTSITLAGLVGDTNPLASLNATIDLMISAASIVTSGTQTYFNTVTLGNNATFTSTNAAVNFATIERSGSAYNLTVDAGSSTISLNGNIGSGGAIGNMILNAGSTTTIAGTVAAASLTTNAGGGTQLNTSAITTSDLSTGYQIYNDNLTFISSPALNASGAITFNGNVTGSAQTLTLQNTSGGGSVSFIGTVSLADLVLGAFSYAVSMTGSTNIITNHVAFDNTAGVTLGNGSGDTFTFNGGVTSTASTTTINSAVSTSNDAVTFGTMTLAGNSSISSGSGTIAVGATSGAFNLNLASSTSSTLNGAINIAQLDLSGGGTDVINASTVTTTGTQSYHDAVTLSADTTLTTTNNTVTFDGALNSTTATAKNLTVAAGNALVTFSGAIGLVNALANLVSSGSGAVTFTGAVGDASHALSSVAITGTATINGGSVFTRGDQTYSGGLALGQTTTLSLVGSGSNTIGITNGISGSQNLTLTGSAAGTHNYSVLGTLVVGNLDISPSAGSSNNTFTLNSGGTQNWLVSAADAGSLSGVSGVAGTFTFSNISNLVGSSGVDTFTMNGGSLTGSISGGAGTDSLTGSNAMNVWTISGANTGSLTNLGGTFNSIENLTGGSNDDTYHFADGATVSGAIDGGTGTNTFNHASIVSPITVFLASTFAGTTKDATNAVINTFSNINRLDGDYVDDVINVSAKAFSVTYTAVREGYIDDPLYFYGYLVSDVPPPTPTPPTPPPTPVSSTPEVANIILQPMANFNPDNGAPINSLFVLTPELLELITMTYTDVNTVIEMFNVEVEKTVGKAQVQAYCAQYSEEGGGCREGVSIERNAE